MRESKTNYLNVRTGLRAGNAYQAAQEGVDTAGELTQSAGKALISAGNSVNTAQGNDTAVAPK